METRALSASGYKAGFQDGLAIGSEEDGAEGEVRPQGAGKATGQNKRWLMNRQSGTNCFLSIAMTHARDQSLDRRAFAELLLKWFCFLRHSEADQYQGRAGHVGVSSQDGRSQRVMSILMKTVLDNVHI